MALRLLALMASSLELDSATIEFASIEELRMTD